MEIQECFRLATSQAFNSYITWAYLGLAVIQTLVEFWLGKTNKTEASSVLELVINIFHRRK